MSLCTRVEAVWRQSVHYRPTSYWSLADYTTRGMSADEIGDSRFFGSNLKKFGCRSLGGRKNLCTNNLPSSIVAAPYNVCVRGAADHTAGVPPS